MSQPRTVKRIIRLVAVGAIAFAATLGIGSLSPEKARADICTANGRDCYYGYFFNGYDGGAAANGTRHNLFSAPAMLNVNNGWDLVNTIQGHLGCVGGNVSNPNGQNPTGAAFIVLTMLGAAPGTNKNVACQRFGEWASNVYNYEASGLTNFNQVYDFQGINTRSTYVDVAYYPMNGAANSIVFYSPTTGQPIYAIKKDCGNPVGRLQAPTANWDLTPSISATVNGVSSGTAETGDSITFTFTMRNNARTDSQQVNCNAAAINHSGYFKTPASPEGGGSAIGVGCPRSFGRNSTTTLTTQTVTATANTTMCRTLFVNPAVPGGGQRGTEVCVAVANKPYLQVFGGDVSAGGELEASGGTCAANPNASIVSWNKNVAGYPGAGVQFAALAMGTIKEFSTAQRSPAGGAGMPGGLSFSSTTQAGNKYGGDFGTAKCIKDYYAEKPASTSAMLPSASVSDFTTGDYAATGTVTLSGGNINPSQKTTLYVDGDLYITGPTISYAGNWAYGQIPMFKVIVRGNIYIGSGVTRLDGLYVAQPLSDLSKGYVYTCATSAAPPTLAAGAFYNSCSTNRLTVNGSIVSRSIQFLRTSGTLRNSGTDETNASNSRAAETFNYGPAFWITQPTSTTTNTGGKIDNYDAITSLPPVL